MAGAVARLPWSALHHPPAPVRCPADARSRWCVRSPEPTDIVRPAPCCHTSRRFLRPSLDLGGESCDDVADCRLQAVPPCMLGGNDSPTTLPGRRATSATQRIRLDWQSVPSRYRLRIHSKSQQRLKTLQPPLRGGSLRHTRAHDTHGPASSGVGRRTRRRPPEHPALVRLSPITPRLGAPVP